MIGTTLSPKYEILIPSKVDVDVELETDGYAVWSYARSHGAALHAEPGENIILNIRLQPVRDVR